MSAQSGPGAETRLTTTALSIADMHCASCETRVREALRGMAPIRNLAINPVRRQLLVSHDGSLSIPELLGRIEAAGFTPVLGATSGADHDLLKRVGVAGLATMQVMMASAVLYFADPGSVDPAMLRLFQYTGMVFCIPVVTYSAVPFLRSGLRGRINMDTPIAMAVIVAFAVSVYATVTGEGEIYFDSVSMFVFLILGARALAANLSRSLIDSGSLEQLLPDTVTRICEGGTQDCAIGDVQPGDVLLVAQGEMLVSDGELVSGHARVDESIISGESRLVPKSPGDLVIAGSYNPGAPLQFRVAVLPDESTLAGIERLAIVAAAEKTGINQMADRVARVFIPSVLAFAGATLVFWWLNEPARALPAALAVLVISCPCALSLAVPMALSAALLRLRNLGLFVRSTSVLEMLPRISDVVFDKTGTLTGNHATLSKVTPCGAFDEQVCLDYAAALEAHSAHPLASAFAGRAALPLVTTVKLHAEGVSGDIDGKAVRLGSAGFCRVNPSGADVYLTVAGKPSAFFTFDTPLVPQAGEVIRRLRQAGLQLTLCSGDSKQRCRAVADHLGIACVAEATPTDKLEFFRGLRRAGRRCLFVGDGLNDIPSLAGTDISIAVTGATALVHARADISMLTSRLAAIPELFAVGNRCRRVIRQNLGWTVAYNLVAIPAAAAGLVAPWLAALGMAGSSLWVTLNAMRLLRARGDARHGYPVSGSRGRDGAPAVLAPGAGV